MNRVIWTPQPRQLEFMRRSEDEVLYGGAAGGGKSDALVCEALRQVNLPFYRACIFRKTYPQLEEIISKSHKYYRAAYPGAKYNDSKHVWTFPSGAKIYFRSMAHKTSYLQYQGLSFEYIGFDELTHFMREEYEYLISRNRANGPGARVYARATANPGGIGHGWVKERFIDALKPGVGKAFYSEAETPEGKKVQTKKTRAFIPATVFDNRILLKNDPGYVGNLASLPEADKKALLYGDWNSFSGQVFTEWRDNPAGYKSGVLTHVIEPFEIPAHWTRYRAYDFGYTKPYAVLWFALDEDGRAYLYRELYGASGANVGLREDATAQAVRVREIEEQTEAGRDIFGVADPAIWDESRGKQNKIIAMFEKEGIYFEKADNRRLSGKMQVHNRLKFDSESKPGLYVFSNCVNTVRTLPTLIYSKKNVEDVDTDCEDHIYDALRYFLMSCPLPAPVIKREREKTWTPLGWY